MDRQQPEWDDIYHSKAYLPSYIIFSLFPIYPIETWNKLIIPYAYHLLKINQYLLQYFV